MWLTIYAYLALTLGILCVFFSRALTDSKQNLAWALSWHATKWRAPSIGVLEMHILLGSHTITHDLDLWQEIREAKPFFFLQFLYIVGIFTQKLLVYFTNNYKVTSEVTLWIKRKIVCSCMTYYNHFCFVYNFENIFTAYLQIIVPLLIPNYMPKTVVSNVIHCIASFRYYNQTTFRLLLT